MLKSREKGRNEIQRTENDQREMWATVHRDPQGPWLPQGLLGRRGFGWRSVSWWGLCGSFRRGLWLEIQCSISAGNAPDSILIIPAVTPKPSTASAKPTSAPSSGFAAASPPSGAGAGAAAPEITNLFKSFLYGSHAYRWQRRFWTMKCTFRSICLKVSDKFLLFANIMLRVFNWVLPSGP